jgi:hypothetical protein
MATQQWEYCEVCLAGYEERKQKVYYTLIVHFYAPNQVLRHQLADVKGLPFAANPYFQAIQLLGMAGWEMVSSQVASAGDGFQSFAGFRWEQRYVMFKRPVEPGRALDDAKLKDKIKPMPN